MIKKTRLIRCSVGNATRSSNANITKIVTITQFLLFVKKQGTNWINKL